VQKIKAQGLEIVVWGEVGDLEVEGQVGPIDPQPQHARPGTRVLAHVWHILAYAFALRHRLVH